MKTSLASLSLVLLALAPLAHAQVPYPTRPIRLIIPYPPAGSTDFVGREVARGLTEAFGHQVVIDNRPGAGTLLGLSLGAKAPADGYTITFGTSAGLAVNPALGAIASSFWRTPVSPSPKVGEGRMGASLKNGSRPTPG